MSRRNRKHESIVTRERVIEISGPTLTPVNVENLKMGGPDFIFRYDAHVRVFDSLLCCDHRWEKPELVGRMQRRKSHFQEVCEMCGAGISRDYDAAGRLIVVDYDAEYRFGVNEYKRAS